MEYDIDDENSIEVAPPIRVIIGYKNREGNVTNRTIDIAFFESDEDHKGYFRGFCHKAKAERTFKIARISREVTMVGTKGKAKVTIDELVEFISSGRYVELVKMSKSDAASNKQHGTGCLVVSVGILGVLIGLPAGLTQLLL